MAIAVERIRKGEYIEESLYTGNIENNQMSNTNYLAKQLEEKFSILLPKSEIGYINLHLVASDQHRDTNELKILQLILVRQVQIIYQIFGKL